MPCSDGGYGEMLRQQDAIDLAVSEYKEKVDNLTDMLCEVCSQLPFEKLPQKVKGWYSRHSDEDRKRVNQTFIQKYNNFKANIENLSGDELRKLEELLDSIK